MEIDITLHTPPSTIRAAETTHTAVRYANPLPLSRYDGLCRLVRGSLLEMSARARTPHLAGALSCVEIVAALYGGILKIDPSNPADPRRDRFIFSKGHAATTLYSTLALFDYFSSELLQNFATNGGTLGEQPLPQCLPGIEAATGSLGHGLSLGLGMALAAKLTESAFRVFVLMSDGECNEGSVWEAAMMAPAKHVDNLVAIVDFNKWQATGRSEEIMSLTPLKSKFEAFGWTTREVDGHDVEAILSALSAVPDGSGRPIALIANTVKGKGISYMEDDNNWHYRIPTDDEVARARRELRLP